MAGIFFNQYLQAELDRETRAAAGIDWTACKVDLYVNNQNPAHGDTEANYTKATWTGYASIALPAPGASVLVGASASISLSTITWNNGSGASQNVYGYLISDNAGKGIAAEIFPGAPLILPAGLGLSLTITLSLSSLF